MLDLENIESKMAKVIKDPNWQLLLKDVKKSERLLLLARGGNLAIAQHCATQINRHTQVKAIAPDSGTVSIWHGEANYDNWLEDWVNKETYGLDTDRCTAIGFSASGKSLDVEYGLLESLDKNIKTHLLTGQPKAAPTTDNGFVNVVSLDLSHYYMAETMFMLLMYELIRNVGKTEVIKSKPSVDSSKVIPRENSVDDEKINLGIDFDGVIHKCSKGFFNGTIYDEPIEGSLEAIKELSNKYNLILFTAKAKPDRPLVDGKTGVELVWEWLEKYDVAQYFQEVTSEKPRAVAYIDDKAIRFTSWEQVLKDLND